MPRAVTLEALLTRASPDATTLVSGDARRCVVDRVEDDSRRVGPRTLFVARSGTTAKGDTFVSDAIDAGAVAVLVGPDSGSTPGGVVRLESDDPLASGAAVALELAGRPNERLGLIGVTGTNGKTTIGTLVRSLVAESLGPCGSIGTIEIHDGRTSTPARLTTPGRIELAGILGRMVEAGSRYAVMEVSSHALHQGRTADLRFDVAVFSNLSGDHLDYHGDMDAYAAAKAMLFSGLEPAAAAVLNLDDAAAPRMAAECRSAVVGIRRSGGASSPGGDLACDVEVRYRIDVAEADRSVLALEVESRGTRTDLEPLRALAGTVEIPLTGVHNAFNATAAAVAAIRLGASPERVQAALGRLQAPRGRLEPVHGPFDAIRVFIDYAHTDDAIRKVLAAVRPFVPDGGTLVAVVGAGGDRDRSKRPRMLRAALDGADRVVVTSDNPRTEDPEVIVDDVLEGAEPSELGRVVREVDRERAIRRAILEAGDGDVVVVAGKGHETHQIVGSERRPFDDADVARRMLESRRST